MGLVGGILNMVGGLLGGGYNQYARSTPSAQPQMKHSWPGMKDFFKSKWEGGPGNSANAPGHLKKSQSQDGNAQGPGNSANAPGQVKKGEDHTDADVKQDLQQDVPQAAPKPADPKPAPPAGQSGAPEVPGRKGPAGSDPKISQFAPNGAPAGYDGTEACGPTVGAMVARNMGFTPEGNKKPTDAELVADLAKAAGTTAQGTTGNGMIAMYEHMGLDTKATKGADLDWMTAELQAGHHVTALGNYYEVPGRIDDTKTSGHYLDITGVDKAGNFMVNDPANTDLNSMTRDEMQKFITTAPQGGFAISAWKPTGAAAGAPAVG
ncbi:MAG TPA: C39 family peptidase [Myxococcaceae bacterium]|nr:C39 family peptidase [Myxococcaceae bacterium]